MASSPTQRSLKLLRGQGYSAQVVEHWVPQTMRRRDLFGCIDIVAVHPKVDGVLGVQTTSATNFSARKTKALAIPELRVWMQAGGRFAVHGWRNKPIKCGPKAKNPTRPNWIVRIEEMTWLDLDTLNKEGE